MPLGAREGAPELVGEGGEWQGARRVEVKPRDSAKEQFTFVFVVK